MKWPNKQIAFCTDCPIHINLPLPNSPKLSLCTVLYGHLSYITENSYLLTCQQSPIAQLPHSFGCTDTQRSGYLLFYKMAIHIKDMKKFKQWSMTKKWHLRTVGTSTSTGKICWRVLLNHTRFKYVFHGWTFPVFDTFVLILPWHKWQSWNT